jgi:hypothetical protein
MAARRGHDEGVDRLGLADHIAELEGDVVR